MRVNYMTEMKTMVNIIGSGLAGLSAASYLAQRGIPVRLISVQQSERAQSNLAEGGINAALNVMGEEDSVGQHFQDTMAGGCQLADPNMVKGLTLAAPELVMELARLGVPFQREEGKLIQRNFGGQKKKRTAYARSSTGKVLMAAMIDQVRRYEARGLVERYCHHRFERLKLEKKACLGVEVWDLYLHKKEFFPGKVIMACGGLNGFFSGLTTGTTANTGSAAARLFMQGVSFANLEFLQYHPTTVKITGKRLLVSEAARGEGGRLFYEREDGSPCYFMEKKYGRQGNLMPRDVISREMARLNRPVWLDLRGITAKTWAKKLSDLRGEILHYLGIDPAQEPLPVSPGIHYFMGGIQVDEEHRTNIRNLYAAGECACAYHGANRLGGNSLLGAVYGGRKAAETVAAEDLSESRDDCPTETVRKDSPEETVNKDSRGEAVCRTETVRKGSQNMTARKDRGEEAACRLHTEAEEFEEGVLTGQDGKIIEEKAIEEKAIEEKTIEEKMEKSLAEALGILREEGQMTRALTRLEAMMKASLSAEMESRLFLARAMILSALARKESRGAHTRLDYPKSREEFHKITTAVYDGVNVRIDFEDIPDLRNTGLVSLNPSDAL